MAAEDLRIAASALRYETWPSLRAVRENTERGSMAFMVLTNLMRSVVQFSLALEQLASRGDLTAEIVQGAVGSGDADQGRALEMGQLHAATVILAGDAALDAVAWAELERRGLWPEDMGDRVASPWGRFAGDAGEGDDMRLDVAYLDMTWCVARDALVAHPDPRLILLPSFSGVGDITLAVATLDEERRADALRLLQGVQRELPWPGRVSAVLLEQVPDDTHTRWAWHHQILGHTLALPELLTITQRRTVNTAQRLAGFESPPIHRMTPHIVSLIRKHAERREAAT